MSTATAKTENITVQNTNMKQKIMWLLVILAPVIVMFLPTGEVFTSPIRTFSAITVIAILLFAFEILPNFVVAILLPIAYVLTSVAPTEVVYRAWATNLPWMFIGGFVLSNVIDRIGLLKRVAYWSILKTGGTYNGILYGLTLAGVLLNLIAPGNATIPMAAFSYGICKALGLGKSKESASIMLVGFFASYLPSLFIYPPLFGTYTALGSTVKPVSITWLQYFINNVPFILWVFLLAFVASKLFKPNMKIDIKDYVTNEYEKAGKITNDEKKAVLVVLALFIFLITSSIHKIDIGWGFALVGCLFFLPGINIGKNEDFVKVNYSTVLFFTACLSIGQVAGSLGIGSIIAKGVLPIVAGKGPFVALLAVWLISVVSNFVLTPLAIIATFTVPFTQIATNLDLNPLAVYHTMMLATSEIIFPYEWALVLVFMSYGLISMKNFVKMWSIKMVMSFIFMLAIVIPYWILIGLV